jgi:hypothetical protein
MVTDHRSFESQVASHSIAMGLLFTICYHLWVITGQAFFGLVPPIGLIGFYLTSGGLTSIWRCQECGTVAVSRQCPQCESVKPVGQTGLKHAAVYLFIVPAGALLTEFLLTVLLVDGIFRWFQHVPVVDWYRAKWAGTVGLFGPMGLFLMTLIAPVAYLLSAGFGVIWASVVQITRSSHS